MSSTPQQTGHERNLMKRRLCSVVVLCAALAGKAVSGPLFGFARAADAYLKTYLFGDIFSRDDLDWKSRELATVGMLAAMSGTEPQLKAHLNMSMNVGVTPSQLAELVAFFMENDEQASADRLQAALDSVPAG